MQEGHPHRMKRGLALAGVIFIVLALPTIFLGTSYYRSYATELTDQVYSERKLVAALSASALRLKLNRLVALATLYASQRNFQNAVAGKRWDDAIEIIKKLEGSDPAFYDYYVDRMFLLDTDGIIMKAFPAISEKSIGLRDKVFTDWVGPLVRDRGTAYVSNVHKRDSVPRLNIVKVLVPIEHGTALAGILRLDIPLNNFSDFGKDVDVGDNGFVYFVDRLGQIVSHPKFSSDGPIVDFSSVPAVNRALHDTPGVDVFFNPIERQERVSAYQTVSDYGWGVVAQEPAADAFEGRDAILGRVMWFVIGLCAIELILAYGVSRALTHRKNG